MEYHILNRINDNDDYPVCILSNAFIKQKLKDTYISESLSKVYNCIAYKLSEEKMSVQERKDYLEELFKLLADIHVSHIVVTDAAFFKAITKQTKAEPHIGYLLPVAFMRGFENMRVTYAPLWKTLYYNPEKGLERINLSMNAVLDDLRGKYTPPGKGIFGSIAYPDTVEAIEQALNNLHAYDTICVDIETFSLKFYNAKIGTIAFSTNKQDGIAFAAALENTDEKYQAIKKLLKTFFINYKGKIIGHNVNFDFGVLIYELFMNGLGDYKGLLEGLEVFTRNFEDTRIIAYLCLNSCSRPNLSLKDLSHAYSGNYAVENIKDISKIDKDILLQYNLVDTLSTFYVYETYSIKLEEEEQVDIYNNIFKPALKDIIHMQLVGMPLDYEKIKTLNNELNTFTTEYLNNILSLPIIKDFVHYLNEKEVDKYNKTHKKQKTIKDYNCEFNPNSSDHIGAILHLPSFFDLPVISKTDTGKPATGASALENMLIFCNDSEKEAKIFLENLIEYKKVSKIVSTFLPPMMESPVDKNGNHALFGSFNLGGTVSGRLSSSEPNLQNLPATGTKYAKVIKQCFRAPKGYILVGLDFDSLEDRISALTTRDENKLKVYLDGYDGHCLRTYSYYTDIMPDIDPNSVDSINSIAEKYPDLRQKSKPITFAKTYQGTYRTLMTKCKLSEEVAKRVDAAYTEMYKTSIEWVEAHLIKAQTTGYVTGAFGLKVRTPFIKISLLNNSRTPKEAAQEGRTAGNALGQSWGLLNSRAASEFMNVVRNSEYALDIQPYAQIHDAQYYLIKNNVDVLKFVNDNLTKACAWQDDPLIYHDKVKLSGTLSVFYPTWADHVDIPNGASRDEILQIIKDYKEKLNGRK